MTVRRADDNQYTLASDASETGDAVGIKGGQYMVQFEGTVGESTISLQVESPNGTWSDVKSLNGDVAVSTSTLPYAASPIDLPAGSVRVAMTGGTPSAIYAYLVGLG